jgi:2',3'-cyclic-nucleotide 2'-phosphodiesterase (5'-nucleotidase family)
MISETRTVARKLGVLLLVVLSIAASCQRSTTTPAAEPTVPTLRLYLVSTTAGALEPCGCTKDQLGGIDHAAALVRSESKNAPNSLVIAAGPLLFANPKSEEGRATQDLWKAEALATAFGEIGLAAWAPGNNDWAAGATELARLASLSRAELLAGNLRGDTAGAKSTRLVTVNGLKVGIAGVSEP